MKTRIKICGLTNEEDALAAAEAGADFLGFVFYPQSPRYVAPKQVHEIARRVRNSFPDGAPRPALVGVFVDDPADRVRGTLDFCGLDLAQLHGSEPPFELRSLAPRAYKALRPQTRGDAEAFVATYQADLPRRAGHAPNSYWTPTTLGFRGVSARRPIGTRALSWRDGSVCCWPAA